MIRWALPLALGALFACGCSWCGEPSGGGLKDAPTAGPEVDPLAFVETFQTDLERLLQKSPSDCNGTFMELRRFVADRRTAFLERARKIPVTKPENLAPGITEKLMRFSADCPVQAGRFNELVQSLSR